ncbi:unnamed protein product [Ectocarpus sp. 13 AM-2016]
MERNSEDRYNDCAGPQNLLPFPAFWKICVLWGLFCWQAQGMISRNGFPRM